MSISTSLLKSEINRWLPARHDEILNDVLHRLKEANGANWWHLIVSFDDGTLRIYTFAELAEQVDNERRKIFAPMSAFDLAAAVTVECNSLSDAEANAKAQQQPNKVIVVMENGAPIGIVTRTRRSAADAPNILDFFVAGQHGKPPMRNGGRDTAPPPPPPPPPIIRRMGGGKGDLGFDVEPTKTFQAYPRVDAKEHVAPNEPFDAVVGFSSRLDETLLAVQPISLTVTPDSKCLVILSAEGVRVVNGVYTQPLALSMDAEITFHCQAMPDASVGLLKVLYVFNDQVVGMATRRIAIGAAADIPKAPDMCAINLQTAPAARTDMQVAVIKSPDGQSLQWHFIAPPADMVTMPYSVEGARGFAAKLITDLRTQSFNGLLAANVLSNAGSAIAKEMPPQFFDLLRTVYDTVQQPPTLLLLTNEPYMPWELALVRKPLLAGVPRFLAAQTCMGRWLLETGAFMPPPIAADVQHITAVASKYGLSMGGTQRELKEAMNEQATLMQTYGAQAIEAKLAPLIPIFTTMQAGHLIHFAVHGMSDPTQNEAEILLADNNALVPNAMLPVYDCGDQSPFVFVFLNACLVGTAGERLGHVAGFPGAFVSHGVSGFIAPLWEVNDQIARGIAEKFYLDTLKADGLSAAEVMRQQRAAYQSSGHTTPMAYIYYGHPALKLQRK